MLNVIMLSKVMLSAMKIGAKKSYSESCPVSQSFFMEDWFGDISRTWLWKKNNFIHFKQF